MYSIISTNSKQVLVWAIMFVLVLSVFPTTVADENDDEWFWDIEENVTDEDGDGSDDTIEIGYDPDTTCDCNISITVYIDIYDENGFVEYIYADHTIYDEYGDWFTQDWTPDYSGTFDFYVYLYDEWDNYEDSWNVTGIDMEPMTGSTDETINVDNGVFNEDDDSLMNDLAFWAHIKSNGEDYVNITVWKKNAIGQWDYYDDGSTDDDGYLTFKNVTGGEYLWDAYHNGNHLSDEGGYAVVDNTYTTGHVGVLQDWDNADDWDDFVVQIPEGNGTSDEGYVEIYDEDDNLVDSGKTDENDGDNWYYFVSYDLEKGNYTHYIYEEDGGDLLQNGSFYSYGSTSTNYDEWFEDWDYETEDTNGDGVANSLTAYYDPDTECNCTVDVEIDMYVYNNDTGDYAYSDYYDHEINGTEDDWFETDNWSPDKDGNYTFEFYLYDDTWNYEDHFNFTVYLECDDDSNNSDGCDNDEWFEDWDSDSVDTDGDNLYDSIDISYNPDTDCDCEVGIEVEVDVYENSTGDWVDSQYDYHTINGTEEEYFEQSWASHESQSYDFYVYMYDENWNTEDEFWIYNVYLYQKSGGGGPGDDDEYFDWIDYYIWDDDDDGYNDTVELDYDPDTTCECNITVTVYIDVYDNDTGAWVDGVENNHTIYHDDYDYFYEEWSPEYNGTFDFYVEMYDEDGNLEEEVEYLDVDLHARASGGGGNGDDDEWFYDWDYYVDPSDTITIGYDPDTECECNVNITVFVDVYDNVTGDWVDYTYDDHTIYNGYSDWFEQDWTASNDGTYDFWVDMYDGDGNQEDDFWIYNVSLESDGGGGNGSDDDEWFYEWDYDVNPSDTINIGYDPDTECECNVTVTVYVDVYESDNGDYLGYVYADHTIYNGYSDWFTQDWTAGQSNHYDFHVTMYDEDWNEEDEFWIYDVYLSSDGGGGGNGSDDGVGHLAFIDDWEEDGNVNDYIGAVLIEDYFKEDAYFEIYNDGELVDSGQAVNEIFISSDLSEGWYEHLVYYEEDGPILQWGPFYSYGNSSDFEIVNVDNAVIDDDEAEVYDDVGFIAHQGDTSEESGVEGVGIEIYKYNHSTEEWDYHAYTETNETGEALLYNEPCGEYEWYASVDDEEGYYEIWAGCDGSGGGGNQTEEYDEWFYDWDYYVDPSDTITIGYDPDTECDCDVNIRVYVQVFDSETGDWIDLIYDDHTIYNEYGDWFEQNWTASNDGTYDFNVSLWDDDDNLEDDFWIYNVSLESDGGGGNGSDNDEYFYGWDYYVDPSDTITIGYDPDTECDCYVDIEVYVDVFDSETGDYLGSLYDDHTIYNGEGDWFEQDWTADYDGTYDFYVELYDQEYGHEEDSFWIHNVSLSQEYNEWIHAWTYYVPEGEDGTNDWNEVIIGYDPETDCDCDVDVTVYIDVYDENDEWVTGSDMDHTINGDEEDWFLQDIAVNESGEYTIVVSMYDDDWNHEEHKEFSLILSDEWFDVSWEVEDDSKVKIDLEGHTNYDGEIDTYYEVNFYRWNENENDWEEIDENSRSATISNGSSASFHFEWEAEESDRYRFVILMSDEMGDEARYEYDFDIVLNHAPVIESVTFNDKIFEGWDAQFEIEAFDEDGDDLEITWYMGDGSIYSGKSIWHGYSDNTACRDDANDDDVCYGTVEVSDGEYIVMEYFEVDVSNVAPMIDMLDYDNNEGTGVFTEGSPISFTAEASDVPSDPVKVSWTITDSDNQIVDTLEGRFMQYFFEDDGEYEVMVTAEDDDGGITEQRLEITINNVAPVITECTINGIDCDALANDQGMINIEEETNMDFKVSAGDPGDDVITYTFNFGDGTSPVMNENGEATHKFATGEDFTVVICAQDDDGAVSSPCKTVIIPVSVIEQLEDEGVLEGLPGFGLLGALSALGVIGILRRRTH